MDQGTTAQLRRGAEEGRSLLNLLIGAIYFFSHRPRALEVDTPFVNAAAEGTEFLVRVGAERAEVVMLDGQVLLQNPQGELRIASGQAAAIPAGAAPAPMIVARPRDAVAWALYYPPILAELAGGGAPPRPLPPGLQAAIERVAANDYAGALAALEAVPEAARDARYYTYRAGVLLNVGRVDEAAAAIQRALALDPNAGEALAQRAIIQVVQNRKADALADARRAVELSPDSGAARIALSYALQANFQLEEARAVLREAVERSSGGRARLGAPCRAGADVRRAGRVPGRGRAGGGAGAGARAHADRARLRGADPDRHRPGQGLVRARDRAGFGQPAAAPRPGPRHHPRAAISRAGARRSRSPRPSIRTTR